jgi:transcriptional regulator with GAF, ATPase, and Fis domain/Tfp pilus assembly protein PilF
MTLVAQALPTTRLAGSAPAPAASAAPSGFVELDDRVSLGAPGLVVVRTSSREAAGAIVAHVARRGRAAGMVPIEARARDGSPMWREVALRLGVSALPGDPGQAAEALARAAMLRRALVVGPMPRAGSWDHAVATDLAALPSCATIVLVASRMDGDDLRADEYQVGAALGAVELQRWWAALAESASGEVAADALAELDSWWSNARHASMRPEGPLAKLPESAERLLAALALAGRAWPIGDIAALDSDESALDVLVRAGAVRAGGGWVAIESAWEERAASLADAWPGETVPWVTRALLSRFADDVWALQRAAELLARAGSSEAADLAHGRAIAQVEDATARREIVQRWTATVGALPAPARLPLCVKAAERALAIGEAEEAFRWAQSASALDPHDPQVTLLLGRAAVAQGDLVAARVALGRGLEQATTDEARALIAAELAEVAYLGGDVATAGREAQHALSLKPSPATRLKARNVMGKLLLAESRWDEADAHFTEDGWAAAAAGLQTEEMRARLNRGIARLSKGMADEACTIFESLLVEGERRGDARACAFALDNLAVVAMLRHDYGEALALSERALRQRVGDRVATARLLGNLAELRRRLGLIEHAEHAVTFGRRMLGPGMHPTHVAYYSIAAARNALVRGNTVEARREAMRALAEAEGAGLQLFVGDACAVATRAALEDGDLGRAGELLERARTLAKTEERRAEALILGARHARACGDPSDAPALEALAAARACGEEDLIVEAHALLAEVHRSAGRNDMARAHVESAIALRDQVAAKLPADIRAAFIARPDLAALAKLHALLGDDAAVEPEPTSIPTRSSNRPTAMPREIIGDDPAIRGLLAAVRKVARANSTVLIRGESGTGKELVAEAIHRASDRASGPMVTVNCAALVETLLLSELFGHEKGAFTGAIARRRGRFEMAEGGTLFLDEIGDISARTQVALLRVLQERTFERVGGTTPIRANVRVICATHRDLKAMVERGEFREDLYYRLRGITLEVAPLRARMGDLPRIAENLLSRISGERGEANRKSLSSEALELLGRHRWPGNVRELENVLRAASLFAEGDVIHTSTLVDNVDELAALAQASRGRPSLALVERIEDTGSVERLALPSDDDGDALDAPLPSSEASATAVAYSQVRAGGTSLPDIKRQIERDCIARALAETKGNITRAAALLGMKRPRLSQLVKQYGLMAVSSEGS